MRLGLCAGFGKTMSPYAVFVTFFIQSTLSLGRGSLGLSSGEAPPSFSWISLVESGFIGGRSRIHLRRSFVGSSRISGTFSFASSLLSLGDWAIFSFRFLARSLFVRPFFLTAGTESPGSPLTSSTDRVGKIPVPRKGYYITLTFICFGIQLCYIGVIIRFGFKRSM
ncbi:hypothetical protein IW261DRAFT_619202 [Armillaria novae-zelandiae]|uniref:Uncharacterized protein n=1 Tax=Armillaria novae-zelandiae TaxID=153914 RepID=A0AA39UFQ8_9AGAR|nr:hypothetical protein IW261DRAFT_619202 [Armillaria novae-zelandiae]